MQERGGTIVTLSHECGPEFPRQTETGQSIINIGPFMPDPAPASPKVERFRCPQCSADMEFDPGSGGMKCRFCGHTEAIASPTALMPERHPLAEAIAPGGGKHAAP